MKRSGIKKLTYEEALAKKRAKDALRAKNPAKRQIGTNKTKPKPRRPKPKTKNKGYQIPAWFKSIPPGSHGSNPTQKRYWKVVSNLVRQRDFNTYRGKCVSCSTRLGSWQEGQAAHYKAFSICNSYFKFNEKQIALSCAFCNHRADGAIGYAFGEELKRRYGAEHLDWIEKENRKYHGKKMEDYEIVARVELLLAENPWFVLP